MYLFYLYLSVQGLLFPIAEISYGSRFRSEGFIRGFGVHIHRKALFFDAESRMKPKSIIKYSVVLLFVLY